MRIETGDSLLHFRLLEKLGEGGMGTVWKAIDTKLDRPVAVKVLSSEVAGDAERLARFEHEAKALAAVNHPNIITIYSVDEIPASDGETSGIRFFAMEFVDGDTLRNMIPDGGFDPDTFFSLAVPIVRAVGAAHDGGVTHRDLKPQNIMVSAARRVKVLDFGLAQATARDPETELSEAPTQPPTTGTTPGALVGTIPYMAPEQLQGKELDARSDIFSLGTVLYELATGQRPFAGDSLPEVTAAILRDMPPPVHSLNPAMPPQLDRIVRHCLQKDPERRYRSARDLRDELRTLRRNFESGAAVAGGAHTFVRAVAVLPLDNLSGDPDEEFFADGMTDALINDLAKIGSLKVISRTSVMQYKGVRRRLKDIARELDVDAVVEGSVVRAGDRIRVTAQLIRADTEDPLWAESYERDLGDVLDLQGEVAHAIADGIEVKLTHKEQARLGTRPEVHPEAHEACLRGRHFWHMRTPASVTKGLECFERAVAVAPDYAPGHAGIADSYIVDGGRYLSVPPDVAYSRARAAALRALAADDGLAEAHTSLAAVLTDYDWDWDNAEREYRKAIELNPGYVTAHGWIAEHLSRMGRHDEAIREAKLARELDPLSLIANVIVAWILFFARHNDDAIRWAHRTLELDPDYSAAHRILGWAAEENGDYDAAIAAHTRAAALSGDSPNFRGQLGRAYALAGKHDLAHEILDELTTLSRESPVSAFDIALIHIALGDHERAFEYLSRAVDEHSDHMPYLKVNPRVDPLRTDPRFDALLDRVGL